MANPRADVQRRIGAIRLARTDWAILIGNQIQCFKSLSQMASWLTSHPAPLDVDVKVWLNDRLIHHGPWV